MGDPPFQETLFLSCPIIYDPDVYFYITLFSSYFILALLTLLLFVFEFSKERLRKRPSKYLAMLLLLVFLLVQAIVYAVPLPYTKRTTSLLCYTLPRLLFFLSWQFLSLHFANAFLFQNASKFFMNFLRFTVFIFFLALTAISIYFGLLTVWFSFLISTCIVFFFFFHLASQHISNAL
jgi:hypothetical protein